MSETFTADDADRYDVRQDRAFTEKLKKLFQEIADENEKDEDDEKNSEASKDKLDDGWRYSPLIQQFCIIYNQARLSLIRSGKSNLVDNLFWVIKRLTYDFRAAVGQNRTDKKNSHKSDRPRVSFWTARNLQDIYLAGC